MPKSQDLAQAFSCTYSAWEDMGPDHAKLDSVWAQFDSDFVPELNSRALGASQLQMAIIEDVAAGRLVLG
jgi:hypothetical protein